MNLENDTKERVHDDDRFSILRKLVIILGKKTNKCKRRRSFVLFVFLTGKEAK